MSEKLFLIFPGQGSQYAGMGADWFQNFQMARESFEEASDHCGLNLRKLCFDGTDADLKATEITQPAILTTSIAMFRVLKSEFGLEPRLAAAIFAGHSLGEYSALVAAGALELGAAARLVHHRGKYMQEAVPAGRGAMAALIFRPKSDATPIVPVICAEATKATKGFVGVANYNSPEQIVISGDALAVAKASEIALSDAFSARKAVPLPVSAPFHCELMRPAAEKLGPELRAVNWKSTEHRYIANVDADVHLLKNDSLKSVPERLGQQISGSVLWTQSVRKALELGLGRAVEIGPGAVLSGLLKRIGLNGQNMESRSIDRLEVFKNEKLGF